MPLGVYLSYPLCAQKCSFCNFASGVFPARFEQEYLECLQREIAGARWPSTPDTIYLGGGTPSRMEPSQLEALLQNIPGRPWKEATIEAAPGSLTREQAVRWREAGINRVSFGVQSFSPRELARTGRKHTPGIVAREVAILREAGLANFNVDLIAGLPGQTAESWQTSLDWIGVLGAPHVSVYMLEVDGDSRLGNEVLLNGKRYGAPDVPPDELVAEFYETAVRHLKTLGIHRYEISNFAKPSNESLHNLKYWQLEPYFGFGADAHSFDGANRWQNAESPQEYVERMRRGDSPESAKITANPDEERFFVGLRLSDGIEPTPEEWRRWDAPIRQFVAQGLLDRSGSRLRLTDHGVLYSNEVFAEFLA